MEAPLPGPQSFQHYPGVELLGFYRPGGFHPIHLGDILHNRYRIINKLGFGSYSTVWLVEDLTSGKFASLKVNVAEVSNPLEVTILHHLRQGQSDRHDSTGQEYLVEILDDFHVEGPNGNHQCIVTEVLGPSISTDIEDIYDDGDLYPIDIAKKLVTQVTRGVAYLHRCGVVHGGMIDFLSLSSLAYI